MLSVSGVKNASKAAAYYTAEDNYYFLGDQSTQWYGIGAEHLGLKGPVVRDTFTAVMEGQLPDGTDMRHIENGVNKHRPGYDLTFSAPKSVSVLALVTGDSFLVEAHKRAVSRTLDEVEKLTTTRTMCDGITSMERTGNLIIARFTHDTSRNLEPHLHEHTVLANATRAEGGWKTLSTDITGKQGFTDVVWKHQVSIGMLYRGFLRENLTEAGYPITTTGPKGEWDITGVPVKPFSSRRQEILDLVGADASARQKSIAALDSREAKHFTNMEAVREHWQVRLAATGFDHQALMRTVMANREKERAETGVISPGLEDAVRQAIDRLSCNSVRFTWDDVMTSVLSHVPIEPGVYGKARAAIDNAIGRGQMLAVNKHQTLFTSAVHVRDEARLAQLAAGLAEKKGGLLAPAGEKGAMAQIADANRAVSLIDVRGGTAFIGELSHSVMKMAERNQRSLVVVAADGAALKRQAAIFSSNPDVMLITADRFQALPLPDKSLVLVSESERFNTSGLHDVLKTAAQQGAVTVVTDTHARRATGFASEVLRAAGVVNFTASPKTENVSITLVTRDSAEDRLSAAASYYAQQRLQGRTAVLQAGNARMREQLTARTRATLAEEGVLGRVIGDVTARIPVWLDASNRNDRRSYREGMVLEHIQRNGLIDSFTVTGISEKLNLLTLSDDKGQVHGLKIRDIDSGWRLFREKKLQIREGEQLRTTAFHSPKAPGSEKLTVLRVRQGNWLFKEKFVMENTKGETLHMNGNAPLYVDYDYVESFGATRSTSGSVIAVLAAKEVTDPTVNLLRRSGDRVIAFTPLDESTINRRLAENRPSVTVSQSLRTVSGTDCIKHALRSIEASRISYPERAMRLAIEKATGTGVTFSGIEVMAEVTTSESHISLERAEQELLRLQTRRDIFPLAAEQGAAGSFITRENFDNEVTILSHITEGKRSVHPLSASGVSQRESGQLTGGQLQAAQLIQTSVDRITAIQGYAGTGKTTQFRTVAAALRQLENPPEIIGLAPTHRAVSELSEAGISSQTIASFLSESSQWQAAGQSRDYGNTLFIIDESSMNGNAQLASLLTIITDGGGRAVLSGDRDQLKSLESGVPFALALDRSAADRAVMQEIVRQVPALRPVVEAMIAGNVREALRVAVATVPVVVPRQEGAFVPPASTVDGKLLITAEEDGADLHALIADDYCGRTAQARSDTLIVAELNSDRMAINDAIHQRLKEDEVLGDSVTLPVLIRVNNTHADLGLNAFWQRQTGNVIRMGEHYYGIGTTDTDSGVIRMNGLDGQADRWVRPAELRKEDVAVFQKQEREISIGEKVRLTATDRERNLRASDMAVISGITDEGKLLLDTGGRILTLDPAGAHTDQHIDYGYAVTTYSSQGASIPYVIALVGAEGSRRMMAALDSTYVALSRAKNHIQVYADDMNKWLSAVAHHSGERETVHDVLMRAEDIRAGREMHLWNNSLPVSETLLAAKTEPHLTVDARFLSGRTPELLWPVMNSYGKQRGNWHVPVSPATGLMDFSRAHYKGAADGECIVLQSGEPHAETLEAADIREATAMMVAHPGSQIVLVTDYSERSDEQKTAAAEEAGGEELARKEDEALEKAVKDAARMEKDEHIPDSTAEKEHMLAEIDQEDQPADTLLDRDSEWADVMNHAPDMDKAEKHPFMNDEANISRHSRNEHTPELLPERSKTLE
ncbi:MobF family relaxase [Pantoea sp. App145]|uniref:MobF family relaxase n=1 Tax=Pantoea sp. App145 TaxID=3071567 RepID=UPI003A7FE1DB